MRVDGTISRYGARRYAAAASIALLALAAQIASAQTPTLKTRTREDRERAYQESRRITLNVQVTDEAGKPITDLSAKDFTLLDNRQARKLVAFHAIDGEAMNDATEVVIVLDAVNSTPEALEAEKSGIFKFLAKSHGPLPYPTSFVLWSNGHLKGTSATTERNVIGRAFVNLTKNLHSNACASDGGSVTKPAESGKADAHNANSGPPAADATDCLQLHFKDSVGALDGIAQQQHVVGGRTILIWVGPGWPLLSNESFHEQTPKARTAYFEEIVTVLHNLRASQVTLDALGARDAVHEPEPPSLFDRALTAGSVSPDSARPGSLSLPVLAQQTGGRVMTASEDVAADLVHLLDDADWYYALSFIPPPAQNGLELRSLEVKISRPGVSVRTITGYYDEP